MNSDTDNPFDDAILSDATKKRKIPYIDGDYIDGDYIDGDYIEIYEDDCVHQESLFEKEPEQELDSVCYQTTNIRESLLV